MFGSLVMGNAIFETRSEGEACNQKGGVIFVLFRLAWNKRERGTLVCDNMDV